jgi:hypothetical protein
MDFVPAESQDWLASSFVRVLDTLDPRKMYA